MYAVVNIDIYAFSCIGYFLTNFFIKFCDDFLSMIVFFLLSIWHRDCAPFRGSYGHYIYIDP